MATAVKIRALLVVAVVTAGSACASKSTTSTSKSASTGTSGKTTASHGGMGGSGIGGATATADAGTTAQANADTTFFVSSQKNMTGNLGGLAGADKRCQTLAAAVGLGDKTWHAYLSVEHDAANGG